MPGVFRGGEDRRERVTRGDCLRTGVILAAAALLPGLAPRAAGRMIREFRLRDFCGPLGIAIRSAPRTL